MPGLGGSPEFLAGDGLLFWGWFSGGWGLEWALAIAEGLLSSWAGANALRAHVPPCSIVLEAPVAVLVCVDDVGFPSGWISPSIFPHGCWGALTATAPLPSTGILRTHFCTNSLYVEMISA